MELIIVFAPLVAFLTAGLFGKQIGDAGAQFVTCAGVIIAAFFSLVMFMDVVFGIGCLSKLVVGHGSVFFHGFSGHCVVRSVVRACA